MARSRRITRVTVRVRCPSSSMSSTGCWRRRPDSERGSAATLEQVRQLVVPEEIDDLPPVAGTVENELPAHDGLPALLGVDQPGQEFTAAAFAHEAESQHRTQLR